MNILAFKTPLDDRQNRELRREFTKKLSERLRVLRKARKLTQQELAEKSGLHLTYVGHLELGRYHPTVFVIWKISKALKISMNELINF